MLNRNWPDLVLLLGSSFWQQCGRYIWERRVQGKKDMDSCRVFPVKRKHGLPPWTLCNKSVNTRVPPKCPFPPPLLPTPFSAPVPPPPISPSSSHHPRPKHTPWLPAGLLFKTLSTEQRTGSCAERVSPSSPTSLISGKTVMAEWALGCPSLPPGHPYMLQMWLQSLEHLFSSWQE